MSESAETDRVVCPASKEPSVRMFIFAGMLLVFGLWCFYDAFIAGAYPYPEDGNINKLAGFYFNRVGGIAFPLLGLIPLFRGIALMKLRLVADDEAVGYEGKPRLAWTDVRRLDATDLKSKGILRLQRAAGKPLILDSWKLNNFKALVAFVERHVPADAIDAPPAAAPSAEEPPDTDENAPAE